MEEATQQGADTQQQAVSEDSDLARRMASIAEGTEILDDGSDEAAEVERSHDDQADDATPESSNEITFKIKVDGEEKELTQSEMIAEVQKSHSANKRFEEAAQMRRQVESEQGRVAQERAQEREQVAQTINHYTVQLQSLLQQGQPDWNALLQQDPIEYLRQKEVYGQYQSQLQQAQAAQAHLEQQKQSDMQVKQQSYMQDQRQKLLDAIPDWQDKAKAEAGVAELKSMLMNEGFTQQDIGSITDHRFVKLLREASLYRSLIAKQNPALKKVDKLPPKVEKTGNGGRTADNRSTAMQRLNKTGRVEDAVGALLNFI